MWPAVNLIGDFVAFLISSDKCEPIEWLCERTEHYIFLFFLPIIQWCSISDILFTGRRGVSDFGVLKYY